MADQKTIEQRVKEIIVNQLNVNEEQITPTASFLDDLGADSLDTVELIMALSKQGNRIPVVAMSGGRRSISPEFSLESAKLLGVKTTLQKPFTHAELRQVVKATLI